jgi:hypothetical protein
MIEVPEGTPWKVYAQEYRADAGVGHDFVSFRINLSFGRLKKTEERIGFLSALFGVQFGIPAHEVAVYANAIVDEVVARVREKTPVIDMEELMEDVFINKGISQSWVEKGYLEEDEEES